MTGPRIGSLCSGYGGLDLAVVSVLGGTVAWHAEVDPAASRVLAHHWPDVPNLGDLRAVDWSTTEPVDVLTAGFPCQPVSQAGQRNGVDDERWLFNDITAAVGRMDPRPRLLWCENVRGLLVANHGDAMARVVHGLARLGYLGRYGLLRASDVGAPHQRARVFIAARLAADANGAGRQGAQPAQGHDVPARSASAHPPRVGRHEGRPEPARHVGGPDAPLGGSAPADPARGVDQDQPDGGDPPRLPVGALTGAGRGDRPGDPSPGVGELGRGAGVVDWGPYTAAVRRWERILGRPAPTPTTTGRTGSRVLNPALPEWMLGLPAGWVTSVPGLSRSAQLRILGNGVCPQQAELALRLLLIA